MQNCGWRKTLANLAILSKFYPQLIGVDSNSLTPNSFLLEPAQVYPARILCYTVSYRIVGNVGGVKLYGIWQISLCFTKVLPPKILYQPKVVKNIARNFKLKCIENG